MYFLYVFVFIKIVYFCFTRPISGITLGLWRRLTQILNIFPNSSAILPADCSTLGKNAELKRRINRKVFQLWFLNRISQKKR